MALLGQNIGGPIESEVSRSYASFSGSDIRACIGQHQFAELQAVSYSVTREKAPIYTLGSPDVRSFSRNKRGIAGSLIWVNFDRHGLLDLVWKLGGQFVANIDDIRTQFRSGGNTYLSQSAIFQSTLVRTVNGQVTGAGTDINDQTGAPMTSVDGMKQLAKPWYSDQILPFDITLAGASELGKATAMKIFGVEILNEGSGVSIDDAVTEMQATFVARYVEPWQAVAAPQFNMFGGGTTGN